MHKSKNINLDFVGFIILQKHFNVDYVFAITKYRYIKTIIKIYQEFHLINLS